ncbi:hypothetical protein ACFL02_08340 [Planctomycetota bacterium]
MKNNKLSAMIIIQLIHNPLSILPNYGKKALTNFLSLSFYSLIASVIVSIVLYWKKDFHVAWKSSLPWLLLSLASYAIGSLFKALNVISRQIEDIKNELSLHNKGEEK